MLIRFSLTPDELRKLADMMEHDPDNEVRVHVGEWDIEFYYIPKVSAINRTNQYSMTLKKPEIPSNIAIEYESGTKPPEPGEFFTTED